LENAVEAVALKRRGLAALLDLGDIDQKGENIIYKNGLVGRPCATVDKDGG